MNIFRRLSENKEAGFRGEKRVKGAERGRCWVKRKTGEYLLGATGPEGAQIKATPTATMRAKITRANGDIEYINGPVTIPDENRFFKWLTSIRQ